jgi:hypothetical protein
VNTASTAVTDSAGDTYTTVLTKATGTNVTGMFYVANAAAVNSVTVHASGTATMAESVQEFSRVEHECAIDVDVGATATSTAPAGGSTATTAQAGTTHSAATSRSMRTGRRVSQGVFVCLGQRPC